MLTELLALKLKLPGSSVLNRTWKLKKANKEKTKKTLSSSDNNTKKNPC